MTQYTDAITTPVSDQRGIVLLEILVALVILAITGSSIISISIQQINQTKQLKATLYAGWVAENQLVQLHLAPGPHAREWIQGENMMGDSSWSWRYRYADSDFPSVDSLQIEVFRPGEHSPLVSVNTLVVVP